jgi:hypothetical protein
VVAHWARHAFVLGVFVEGVPQNVPDGPSAYASDQESGLEDGSANSGGVDLSHPSFVTQGIPS